MLIVSVVCLTYFGYAGQAKDKQVATEKPAPRVVRSSVEAPAWLVSQVHHMAGQYDLTFTAAATKVVSKRSGYEIISRAPDWTVCIYNPSKKLRYDESLTDWVKYGLYSTVSAGRLELDVKQPGSASSEPDTVICGIKCHSFKHTMNLTNRKRSTAGLSQFGGDLKSLIQTANIFDVPVEIEPLAQRDLLFQGLYKFPARNTILFRKTALYNNNTKQKELDTVCCKKTKIADSAMQYPPDSYKAAKRVEAVTGVDKSSKNFEDLMEGLSGFGDVSTRHH